MIKNTDEIDKLKNLFNDLFLKMKTEEDFYKNKEDIYFKVHTLKGLCGLYNLKELFNELYSFEKKLKIYSSNEKNGNCYVFVIDFMHNIKKSISEITDMQNAKQVNFFQFHKVNIYSFELPIHTMEIFYDTLTTISNISYITKAQMFNKCVKLEAISTLTIKEINLILMPLKVQNITQLFHHKLHIDKCNFLSNINTQNRYNTDKLKLKILEMCNSFSDISKVDFDYKFVSNFLFIDEQFYFDFQIPIMEIIKNSFSHSHKDKIEIKISLKKKHFDKLLELKIINNGKKIKDLSKIFNKLYTTSQDNNLSGNGIGLYETKRIVNKHFGTIKAKNVHNGVMFKVILINNYN